MKLKTLKDIEFKVDNSEIDVMDGVKSWEVLDESIKEQIKQEAIKWIKEINTDHFVIKNDIPSTAVGHFNKLLTKSDKALLTMLFRMFFNINDGDLK